MLKRDNALRLNDALSQVLREIYGFKPGWVLVIQASDELDVATNARPSDLKAIPGMLSEAAEMVAASGSTIHEHFDAKDAN